MQMMDIKERGAKILELHQVTGELHPRIAPLAVLQRFYLDVRKFSIKRRLNPDDPVSLNKVIEIL